MRFCSAILGTLWCIVVRDDDNLLRCKVVFSLYLLLLHVLPMNLHLPQTQYPFTLSRRRKNNRSYLLLLHDHNHIGDVSSLRFQGMRTQHRERLKRSM